MLPPNAPQQKSNRTAIAWALISQSIWVPAFLINSQDQLTAKNSDYNFTNTAKLPYQDFSNLDRSNLLLSPSPTTGSLISKTQTSQISSGIVLNAVEPSDRQLLSVRSDSFYPFSARHSTFFAPTPPPPSASSVGTALFIKPGLIHDGAPTTPEAPKNQTSSDYLKRLYSRADLLGGTLTLRDLDEPDMPPIARAERAQWVRSGDPLAPIPQIWRESMRKALHSLTFKGQQNAEKVDQSPAEYLSIDTARIVHVPSKRLKRAADVPLALQSDGSVDILNNPDDPAVVEEINNWSASQKPPSKGRMTPAVVHLHPLSPVESSSLPPASGSTKVNPGFEQRLGSETEGKAMHPFAPAASSESSSTQQSTPSPAPQPPEASVQPAGDLSSEPPPQPQSVDVSNSSVISIGEVKP